MKHYYRFVTLCVILCLCIVNYLSLSAHGNGNSLSVILNPVFTINTAPEGPKPGDDDHYVTFEFGVTIDGFEPNEYYDIEATLKSSKFTGTMANYGFQTDEDLKFNRDDYISNGKKILVWNYVSIKKLTKEIGTDANSRTVPTTVKIRCHDWGPTGTLIVKVKKRCLFGESAKAEHSVPWDKNGNGIWDGFASDATTTHSTWLGGTKGGYKASADDETFAGNNNKGDGWSNHDEYRGHWNGSKPERLNPSLLDVLYTTDSGMSSYGTGNVSFPYHNIMYIDPGRMKSYDGGSAITGYEFCVDTDNDDSWSSWRSTTWGTSTSVRLRGVSSNTQYAFKVRAVNSVGSSSSSNKVTITTPASSN